MLWLGNRRHRSFTCVSSAKTGLRCGNWLLSEDVAQDAAGVQAKGGKGIALGGLAMTDMVSEYDLSYKGCDE